MEARPDCPSPLSTGAAEPTLTVTVCLVVTPVETSASGGGAAQDAAPEPRPPSGTVLSGNLRMVWLLGVAVFGVQFVLLVLHSWYLWDHFDLTADFGQYSQAWQQIATGHLNPYDTTYPWFYPHYGYPFYQGDLELIMWPLALLYWVWPHAIDLLIVQDVALAGAGLVAFRWVLEHLQNHAPNRRFAVAVSGCVLAILVLQPWTYWAASYDYHSEPLATFFTLLAGRDLWAGRRRGWIWVVLVLLVRQRGRVLRGRPGHHRPDQWAAPMAHRCRPHPHRGGLVRCRRSRAFGEGCRPGRVRLPSRPHDGERHARGDLHHRGRDSHPPEHRRSRTGHPLGRDLQVRGWSRDRRCLLRTRGGVVGGRPRTQRPQLIARLHLGRRWFAELHGGDGLRGGDRHAGDVADPAGPGS